MDAANRINIILWCVRRVWSAGVRVVCVRVNVMWGGGVGGQVLTLVPVVVGWSAVCKCAYVRACALVVVGGVGGGTHGCVSLTLVKSAPSWQLLC
jgi:hypothetical protein